MITAIRYHDVSIGHRVVGHESKCAYLHGHNYRIHFEVDAPELDKVGRVLDFSDIKTRLCMWLEENWDHKFLCWEQDDFMQDIAVRAFKPVYNTTPDRKRAQQSFIFVPFNPTAENMAEYLVTVVGPEQLKDTNVRLVRVVVEETRKCACSYTLDTI